MLCIQCFLLHRGRAGGRAVRRSLTQAPSLNDQQQQQHFHRNSILLTVELPLSCQELVGLKSDWAPPEARPLLYCDQNFTTMDNFGSFSNTSRYFTCFLVMFLKWGMYWPIHALGRVLANTCPRASNENFHFTNFITMLFKKVRETTQPHSINALGLVLDSNFKTILKRKKLWL